MIPHPFNFRIKSFGGKLSLSAGRARRGGAGGGPRARSHTPHRSRARSTRGWRPGQRAVTARQLAGMTSHIGGRRPRRRRITCEVDAGAQPGGLSEVRRPRSPLPTSFKRYEVRGCSVRGILNDDHTISVRGSPGRGGSRRGGGRAGARRSSRAGGLELLLPSLGPPGSCDSIYTASFVWLLRAEPRPAPPRRGLRARSSRIFFFCLARGQLHDWLDIIA